ncbi:MAG: hypothetical protein AAGE52_40875, partial [Myxococcota bacterium]
MLPSRSLDSIVKTQRLLLAFDQYADTRSWVDALTKSLAPLVKTERIYFIAPEAEPDESIRVYAPSMGDTFAAGIEADFVGFAPTGHSIFSEDYSTLLHQLTYAAGPTAIHDAPLFDERSRRELRLQAEVFDQVAIL